MDDRSYIRNAPMQAPGLQINAGNHLLPDLANDFLYKLQGNIYNTADFTITPPTLAPLTLTDGFQCAITIFLDENGVMTYEKGAEVANGTPLTTKDLVQDDETKAIVGYIIMKNEMGADWVGGTDDIDESGMTSVFLDESIFIGM